MAGSPNPLRSVVNPHLRGGGSIFAPFKYHWWELDLECGHTVERRIRYVKIDDPRRGYAAQHRGPGINRVPAPPKRARCHECVGRSASRWA